MPLRFTAMLDTARIRAATHERMRSVGVSTRPPLPHLEQRLRLRPKAEIAGRANGLHLLYAVYLRGAEAAKWSWTFARDNGWEDHLSTRERTKLAAGSVSEHDIVQYSWRKESCKALLWLGSVVHDDDFHTAVSECDLSDYYSLIPPERPYPAYLADFDLRSGNTAVEALDLYYCLHWLCRNEPDTLPFLTGVVVERRRALEWALSRADWDDVPLDT
jgi:hypothetical protein